jgi:hypothetical protein
MNCECSNWPRGINENPIYAGMKSADDVPLLPNHHPNCQHYNDSLIDVWMVAVDGVYSITDNEQDAKETAFDNEDRAVIEQTQMHREVFENLPEFDGF